MTSSVNQAETAVSPAGGLPSYVGDLKVRTAVEALLAGAEELPDGLYAELTAYRDMLYLRDLTNMRVEGGLGVSGLLADILRCQVRDGVLRQGMTIAASAVARAYEVGEADARAALEMLAGEGLVGYRDHARPVYTVAAALRAVDQQGLATKGGTS